MRLLAGFLRDMAVIKPNPIDINIKPPGKGTTTGLGTKVTPLKFVACKPWKSKARAVSYA
jgi:hypothetical protein